MFKFWFGSLVCFAANFNVFLNDFERQKLFARFFVDDGRIGAVKSLVDKAHDGTSFSVLFCTHP